MPTALDADGPLETLADLVNEWEAGQIARHEFYVRLLPLINAENVDTVMRQKLPKGVRMHFFRDVVERLDEGYSSSTDNTKSHFDIVLEWARANMDFARSVAFPLSADPTEIDDLLRALSEHLVTWARHIHKRVENGTVDLPDNIVQEVRAWYAEQEAESKRKCGPPLE